MKKIILQGLLSIALLGLFTIGYSQEKGPQDRANKWTDWMKKNLQLTDDQVAKVQPVNLKYAAKVNELKADTSKGNKKKLDAVKEIDGQMDAELKPIFTQEQYQSYVAKKKEMKEEKKSKKGGDKKSTPSEN